MKPSPFQLKSRFFRMIQAAMLMGIFCNPLIASAAEEEEDTEPTPYEIGLAKGIVREFSPEAGRILDQLQDAAGAKDRLKIDAAIAALNGLGINREYTHTLDLAARFSDEFAKLQEEAGELTIRLFKNLLTPNLPQNVVKGRDGGVQPAPGYAWVSKARGDFRVYWQPGKHHSSRPHVIAAENPGHWFPATGYQWAIAPGSPNFALQVKAIEQVETRALTREAPKVTENSVPSNSFYGIGVSFDVSPMGDHIVLKTVEPSQPAFRAGLRTGTMIYEINGQEILKKTPEECVKLVREGPRLVEFTARKSGEQLIQKYQIKKELITPQATKK